MKSRYGLNILDHCTTPVREQHVFSNLPPSLAQRLNAITSPASILCAALVFREGQQRRGTLPFAPERQSCPPPRVTSSVPESIPNLGQWI
jgi:hypothetical protein